MILRRYARICWNAANWERPTGKAKDGPKTFFWKFGFGHEEWLLDPSAEIDGWQYAFLQPVNWAYRNVQGQTLSLRLYTIPGGTANSHREMFELNRCQVLMPGHAREVVIHFRQTGRLRRMIAEVKAVGGDPTPLTKAHSYCEDLVNIRFRPGDLWRVPKRQPIVRADYYHLYTIPNHPDIAVDDTYPDEIGSSTAWEGRRKKVLVNIYERNPVARSACLKKWGCRCVVCDMSFKDEYGAMADGFIHAHHIVPVSQVGKTYEVDGVRDLRPVCPNCHAMLHHGPRPPTIEVLRECRRLAALG